LRFGVVRNGVCSLAFTALLAFAQTPQPDPADLTPEEVADQQNYDQPLRPQFHYTPIQGHIGDATGLIYYRGEYHLFNMYDEWSRKRLAHKRWGHAVSTDLVHWTQLPALLDTLLDNKPGSGSGVVDWNDSSKLRAGPEKTLVIFYTDYKKGTCILYSRDSGRTWVRYGKNPVIAGAEDARDPTVFWYPAANEWRMIRYEKKGFAFYRSPDLLQWAWLSRIEGYYECPDFFELPVLNAPGQRRWVLIDGNGSYVLGRFDGTRFLPETDKLQVEYGKALYATQTWKLSMEPGRVYQMAWMRYPIAKEITWNGQMSFPVELTLRAFPDGIRLCREPIDELNNLRIAQHTWENLPLPAGGITIPELSGDLIDIRAEMKPAGASDFGLTIYGHEIRYSTVDRKLRLDAVSAPLNLPDQTLRMRILADRSSIEVFADMGQVTLSAITLENPNHDIRLAASGADVMITFLEANRLESIWPHKRSGK
jgi:sucrose-6-phosphate hydrolase SacC (GH32 family)